MTAQLRNGLLLLFLLHSGPGYATAQKESSPSTTAVPDLTQLVHAAVEAELATVAEQGVAPLRYRIAKRDDRGTTVRDVINTRQGPVTRLLERNGQRLTAEEDSAERARLQDMLDDPSILERHLKRNASEKEYSAQLLRALPDALLFKLAPGQPQSGGAHGPETVLDFTPNPNFHPPTTLTEGLRNIEGRLWLDTAGNHMVRLQGRIRAPTDIGLGILARIYPGGTVLFEQQPLANGRWVSSHLEAHLTIRELLLHKQAENTTLFYTNYTSLPAPLDGRQAVELLLHETVPTR